MPVVTVRSAVCVLGGFPALAGADLDVDEGEILLVGGPNGAGKSTLLRVIAGLLPLRSGTVHVLGHDVTRDRTAHRRRLALVGHDTACYDDLTVVENARFAVRAAGLPVAAADDALAALGLDGVRGVAHGRLSAGQRRRLALAIAIARDPELLLLDEPHAGLDAETRQVLDDLLARAPAQGRTVILASHELDHARGLATREVRVDGGLVRVPPRLAAPGTAPGVALSAGIAP